MSNVLVLRLFFLDKGIDSKKAAKRLGISNSSFGRIENKEVKRTSFRHAIKIVRAAYSHPSFQ
ncbi:MAG: hypothetical protein A2X86_16660 [Bdellovibrionales bacterium GWA2_49_15]|nr:MAG: hypothetical protein A2X86_16660 [Bdellovibrionales bacterium GWA2_49_15]HAZ14628.1 hypothetical protein [Bdellovibrionales bacterium]